MGIYINPSDMSKEAWLAKHGVRQSLPPVWSADPMPVCLVDNGAFTAAAIAFSPAQMDVFDDPADRRRKVWYVVSRSDLEAVEPDLKGR